MSPSRLFPQAAPTPAGGLTHSALGTISGLLPVLAAMLGRAGRPRNVVTGPGAVPEVCCPITPCTEGSCTPELLLSVCPVAPGALQSRTWLQRQGCALQQTAGTRGAGGRGFQ